MNLKEEIVRAGTIFIDTAPFIYFVEAHEKYGILAKEIFDTFQKGRCKAYSTVITLTEVLPKPLLMGSEDVVRKFTELFVTTQYFSVLDVTLSLAETAGRLRANYQFLKTVDALQLAAAIEIHAQTFITNDKPLRQVKEINLMILDDYL